MINYLQNKKFYMWFFLILVIFVFVRIPAINRPYHQDEYKWVMYSHPEIIPPGTVPHPPLTEFIYTKIAPIFGDSGFRMIPFLFSFLNLFLLFILVREVSNYLSEREKLKVILWSLFIFTFSFYSILASTMVDVDGAVMPMFLLILFISYFKLKNSGFKITKNRDWFWILLLIVGSIGGFFVKVSGILPIFAVFLDFLIEKKVFVDKKKTLKYFLFGVLGFVFLVFLLLVAKLFFPFFDLQYSLKYWKHFAVLDRGWMQTFIQFVKSILYTSPLLILPLFFLDREIFKKTRPFFIYIFTGLFFYLLAFDFSLGALDRYFQFLVVPLSITVGMILSKNLDYTKCSYLFFGTIGVLVVYFLQFIPHSVPSLYPKTEWVGRILSFKWNFLYPFFGGSGPLGFYISFLFLGLVWLFGFSLVLFYFFKKQNKNNLISLILLLGLFYNGVFIQEYLFGTVNGSAPKLVKSSVEFIENNQDIKRVLVYNDNGGWNIRELGKYERRLYAVPGFESTYEPIFKEFRGHVLYIDVPKVMSGSIYEKYFNSCDVVYLSSDKYINSKIYECGK